MMKSATLCRLFGATGLVGLLLAGCSQGPPGSVEGRAQGLTTLYTQFDTSNPLATQGSSTTTQATATFFGQASSIPGDSSSTTYMFGGAKNGFFTSDVIADGAKLLSNFSWQTNVGNSWLNMPATLQAFFLFPVKISGAWKLMAVGGSGKGGASGTLPNNTSSYIFTPGSGWTTGPSLTTAQNVSYYHAAFDPAGGSALIAGGLLATASRPPQGCYGAKYGYIMTTRSALYLPDASGGTFTNIEMQSETVTPKSGCSYAAGAQMPSIYVGGSSPTYVAWTGKTTQGAMNDSQYSWHPQKLSSIAGNATWVQCTALPAVPGEDNNNSSLCAEFNQAAGCTDSTHGREGAVLATTSDNRVIAFGGAIALSDRVNYRETGDIVLFDPSQCTGAEATYLGQMQVPRMYAAVVQKATNQFLVFGGRTVGHIATPTAELVTYNPTTHTITSVTCDSPLQSYSNVKDGRLFPLTDAFWGGLSAGKLDNGNIYVVGGSDYQQSGCSPSTNGGCQLKNATGVAQIYHSGSGSCAKESSPLRDALAALSRVDVLGLMHSALEGTASAALCCSPTLCGEACFPLFKAIVYRMSQDMNWCDPTGVDQSSCVGTSTCSSGLCVPNAPGLGGTGKMCSDGQFCSSGVCNNGGSGRGTCT